MSHPLTTSDIQEVVQSWIEGESIEGIRNRLDKKGKVKSIRYLKKVFMGATRRKETGLKRTHSYLEAMAKYVKNRPDPVFGDDIILIDPLPNILIRD